MADIQKLNINSTTYDICAKYVLGSNACSSPENALLRSGSGRSDSSPAGDTWLFIDNLGAMTTPWGIKHEQQDNLISFYGAGDRTSYIDLSNGNVVCSTINSGTPITSNNIGSQSVNYANSAGSVGSVAWSNVSGKPSTFPPESHTHSYLPLSGGTITGDLSLNQYLRINAWSGYGNGSCDMWYNGNNGILSITAQNITNYWGDTFIHSGNIGNYSITSTKSLVSNAGKTLISTPVNSNLLTFTIPTDYANYNATGSQTYSFMYFQKNGIAKASVGYYEGMAFIANETSPYPRIGVTDGGIPMFWETNSKSSKTHTLLHTGNYSNYCAPISHGIHWNNFYNRALSNASWGNLTSSNGYTPIFWMDSVNGGGVAFSDYNGQTFMQIDGDYYAQEGQYKVWHAGNLTKVSQLTNDMGYKTTDTNTWRPVTNTYTGSDQSTCVSQYGTNALYNALVNGYASSAGSASLLTKQGGTSTATSVWNPLTSYKKVWGQNFTDTSISGDTGDILYYLRKGSGSSTELCVCIDGDYYAMGNAGTPQRVWHAGNLTNLNQLTNGPGYITGINKTMVTNALGYTPPSSNTNTWFGDGTWGPGTNITLTATGNSQEWSFDIYRNGYSNCYWHVWDNSLGSLLTVYPSNGQVHALGGFFQNSDERLKDFYDSIPVDLDKLSKLRKNYFKFHDRDKIEIGVSAQEVQALYPEIVNENKDGYLTVAYDKLAVVALAAVDKLHEENKQLKSENDALRKRIEAIENILNKLTI